MCFPFLENCEDLYMDILSNISLFRLNGFVLYKSSTFLICLFTDVDECILGNASCPSGFECVNTPGAYRCRVKCPEGFVMTDNETCVGNACFFRYHRKELFNRLSAMDSW